MDICLIKGKIKESDSIVNHHIQEILKFWFAEAMEPNWFNGGSSFDKEVCKKLGPHYERALANEYDCFKDSAAGCVALCILLDQYPRNVFRGSERAFSSDSKACSVAKHALLQGFDQKIDDRHKMFLYLPFEHSENLGDQDESVRLFEATGNEMLIQYAKQHYDLIKSFGRFPYRNKAMGRKNTPEEEEYLSSDGMNSFGQ